MISVHQTKAEKPKAEIKHEKRVLPFELSKGVIVEKRHSTQRSSTTVLKIQLKLLKIADGISAYFKLNE